MTTINSSNPALCDMLNGETVVDQSTMTTYYVEQKRLNGEWVPQGPSFKSILSAKRHVAGRNSDMAPCRIKIHTRHIIDVDTWVTP